MSRVIEYQQQNASIRVVIIGDSNVGKKSLITRLIKDTFDGSGPFSPRSNSAYILKGLASRYIKIYEIATQSKSEDMLRTLSKRNIRGVILIYDTSNLSSFLSIKTILSSKLHPCHLTKLYLVGNKSDLIPQRVISYDTGKQLADEIGAKFLEISVKTSFNISSIFSNILSSKP